MRVSWTDLAISSFHHNIEYLEVKWGEKEIDNFIEKTDEAIELIEAYPRVFPMQNRRLGIRKCVVMSPISLYYRINCNNIDLLLFWMNKMNPSLLNAFIGR